MPKKLNLRSFNKTNRLDVLIGSVANLDYDVCFTYANMMRGWWNVPSCIQPRSSSCYDLSSDLVMVSNMKVLASIEMLVKHNESQVSHDTWLLLSHQ
jgi:hypothetical protein